MSPKEPHKPIKTSKEKKNPNPKLEILRRQMREARNKTHSESTEKIDTTTAVIGLTRITNNPNSPNLVIANHLLRIFARASSGEYQMVADEKKKDSDHNKLFSITKKVIRANRIGKKVSLSNNEKNTLKRYQELL